MRILHVLSTLNIGSGIANFVLNYYREIINYDIQFDFLVFQKMPNDYYDEVVKLGARVFYIEKPTLNVAKYKKKLQRFFAEHVKEWEIVHIHEILVQKYVSKSAKKYGAVKKIIIHSHAAQFVLPISGVSAFKNRVLMGVKKVRNAYLLSGLEKNGDYFFACSLDAGRALFSGKALAGNSFYIAKNSIGTERYRFNDDVRNKYRAELGIAGKKAIALIGRLCAEKNQFFFLDVFKKIIERDNSYRLLLIGDGELKAAIIKNIEELEISDKVTLTGNREDVAELLSASDLFVLPSVREGLGMVLIEAQAAGLPCVRSDGVPDEAVITPYVKTIALKDDANIWAEEILTMPLERYDGSTYVFDAKYDIQRNAEDLAEKYREIVGQI